MATIDDAIGVFDSGIGGLTVVKKIAEKMPNENIIYFGDTARVPYGTKSNSTVIEYSLQDAGFLVQKNVKLIVVACNTASSVALPALREKFDVPVIGMIFPGAALASKQSGTGKIGVIGTNATVNNKAYSNELLKIDSLFDIIEKACPLFVPLAEEGWVDHRATKLIAKEYLQELKDYRIDTLILGCTHYPLLTNVIKKAVGDGVKMIDSGTAAAITVEYYLINEGLRNYRETPGRYEYFVSDLPEKFKSVAERFLGKEIDSLKKVDIEYLLGLI